MTCAADSSDEPADTCCAVPDGNASPCPRCGTTGPVVGALPVRPHRGESTTGDWQFCSRAECPVIYHLGGWLVEEDGVITQVAMKALDKPTPVCFCFAHTADDIAANLAEDGTSSIKESIKDAVAAGFCACEHLNPSGKCCLPDVRRAIKTAIGSKASA